MNTMKPTQAAAHDRACPRAHRALSAGRRLAARRARLRRGRGPSRPPDDPGQRRRRRPPHHAAVIRRSTIYVASLPPSCTIVVIEGATLHIAAAPTTSRPAPSTSSSTSNEERTPGRNDWSLSAAADRLADGNGALTAGGGVQRAAPGGGARQAVSRSDGDWRNGWLLQLKTRPWAVAVPKGEVARSFGSWLRGRDLNPRPLGYEPNELPDCSTPRHFLRSRGILGTRPKRVKPGRHAPGGPRAGVDPGA